jgi:hypothetical protein
VHWKAQNLGLTELGPITRIDRQASPYGGSHLLVTEATPGEPKKPASLHHASPVRDDVTPKGADGQPLFAPVWQYMAFA